MKVIYTFLAFAIMTTLVFGQGKQAPLKVVKNATIENAFPASSGMKAADTDTLTNISVDDVLTVYGFGTTTWGTWSGHNQYSMPQFAEYFTNTIPGEVNGAIVYVNSAYSGGAGHSVTFNVYADGATPGTVLGSKTVEITNIVAGDLNDITFDTPIAITGNFYVGYTINYVTPADTFNVVMAESTTTRPATAFLNYNGAWTSHNALSSGALNTSLAIFARCALQVPTTPTPQLDVNTWNAGDIEVAQNVTSGTFTLTNIGSGTLTCSGITGVSAPFTTSLVPASVSLAQGASTTFTFTFAPTVAGTTTQTATIATNGGNVTISLTGMAHDPYVGNLLGTFENITDFEYVNFPGWAQIDNDLLPTYGFTNNDFTNSGYTGSYIIFNPAMTVPALTDAAILPHGGARFAACIDAIPAAPVTANDDWLITPQSLAVTAGSTFSAWVKSYTSTYGLERYAIWVSTTGTAQANFTKISAGTYLEAPVAAWTQITYPLDAYIGSQVYVAIQCVSADAFVFMVDDVVVDIVSGTETATQAEVAIFPNPTSGRLNILNAENVSVEVYNIVGKLVMSENNVNSYIDLSNLAAGSYYVRVNTGSKVYTQKVNLTK